MFLWICYCTFYSCFSLMSFIRVFISSVSFTRAFILSFILVFNFIRVVKLSLNFIRVFHSRIYRVFNLICVFHSCHSSVLLSVSSTLPFMVSFIHVFHPSVTMATKTFANASVYFFVISDIGAMFLGIFAMLTDKIRKSRASMHRRALKLIRVLTLRRM